MDIFFVILFFGAGFIIGFLFCLENSQETEDDVSEQGYNQFR